jgi:hypothetical protein
MKNLNPVVKTLLVLTLPIIVPFIPLVIFAVVASHITPATFQGVCSSAPFWIAYIILAVGCFIAIGQELFD